MIVPSPLSMSISSDMLAAFLKVAERSSVSGAAAELGVEKSLISKRIAQLEDKVQATLFSRSTRKVVLTPAGEAYVDYARRALSELTAGEERLRELRSELTGRIRLTAPVSWGLRVLARLLPGFLHRHPAIEIDLQLADRKLDVAFERIDVALRWSTYSAPDLTSIPVATVGWLLAASPGYLAAAGTPDAPADLAGHACLCYWRETADDAWNLSLRPDLGMSGSLPVRVRSRYHVDNPDAVADAAMAGLGIAMLPDYLCEAALRDGSLVRVLPAWTPVTRFGTQIAAVAAPERMSITRNRVLVTYLQGCCGTAAEPAVTDAVKNPAGAAG